MKDIQLSSALAVLQALGMIETFRLSFPDDSAGYDDRRDAVTFLGRNDTKLVGCAISAEALKDHFGATGGRTGGYLKAFLNYRDRIRYLAQWKYSVGLLEEDGSVLVRSSDVA